jgi:hypothetical protein
VPHGSRGRRAPRRATSVRGVRRLVIADYVLDHDVAGGEIAILSIRHGQQIGMDPDLDADFEEAAGSDRGHPSR